MGRILLFTGWACLLVVALFSAYYTGKLQHIDRQAVAIVKMVNGKVFQRPENYSVYESLKEQDQVYDGDYISTGAGAKAEVQLLNSKSILIGENSLIQLSFRLNSEGLGSDIVTLLKGYVASKTVADSSKRKKQTNLSFKVGKSSVNNLEASADIAITKELEQTEASIKVVTGSAQIVGEDNTVKNIEKNETVVVAAAKIPTIQTTENPIVEKDLPVDLPIIKASPQKIAVNDSQIMKAPENLNSKSFAEKTLVEDDIEAPVPAQIPANFNQTPPLVIEEPVVPKQTEEVVPPKTADTQVKESKPVKIAAFSKNKKIEEGFSLILFKDKPQVFVGDGIYFVKNQRLYAKIVGKPKTADLVSQAKNHAVSFYYEGNAEAFLGGAEQNVLDNKSVVYAVNKNGIQRIDATLLRTRPAALDLLQKNSYSIFDEKVNVLSVGH